MKIYIILRDTASEFVPEIKIIGAFTTLDSALPTFKTEVSEARKLAKEKGYVIEESVGDLSFESYQEGYASENHYNVSLQAVEMEDRRSVRQKLSDSIQVLKDITQSGYIPFASPAPSSTEGALKRELNTAIERLESTLFLHDSLYHGK